MEKSHNKTLLKEIWDYMRIRKRWWLTPIIVMLLIVGLAIIATQGNAAVSMFIYALF